MDYISSRKICYLGCDMIRFVDENLYYKGLRIAYMMMKMLENKGGFDEYETAELAFLSFLNVIGELGLKKFGLNPAENEDKVGAYAALYAKQYSIFGERAEILRLSNLDCKELNSLDYKYANVAGMLRLIKKAEKAYVRDGKDVSMKDFEGGAGVEYSTDHTMLLLRCIRRDEIFAKMERGEYEQELWDYMDNALFTNEEKDQMIDFVFKMSEFRGTHLYLEAYICRVVADFLAAELLVDENECKMLHQAAMFRDIGLLTMPDNIVYQRENLQGEELKKYRSHVDEGEKLLRERFRAEDIIEIAISHHERIDGKGYPKAKKGELQTRSIRILQVADVVASFFNAKLYPTRKSHEEIKTFLKKEAESGRMDDRCVRHLLNHYEEAVGEIDSAVKRYSAQEKRFASDFKVYIQRFA